MSKPTYALALIALATLGLGCNQPPTEPPPVAPPPVVSTTPSEPADTSTGPEAPPPDAGQGEVEYASTPSGLQYYIAQQGTGEGVRPGQEVTVHYTGLLQDGGTQFDSSVGRAPFTFTLGSGMVIAGWDEGVAGMKRGEKRRLVIPGDLAYGAQGRPGRIPPNATLIFDIELLDFR